MMRTQRLRILICKPFVMSLFSLLRLHFAFYYFYFTSLECFLNLLFLLIKTGFNGTIHLISFKIIHSIGHKCVHIIATTRIKQHKHVLAHSSNCANAHKDLTALAIALELELFVQAINSIMNYMPSCKLKCIFPSVCFSRAHNSQSTTK